MVVKAVLVNGCRRFLEMLLEVGLAMDTYTEMVKSVVRHARSRQEKLDLQAGGCFRDILCVIPKSLTFLGRMQMTGLRCSGRGAL